MIKCIIFMLIMHLTFYLTIFSNFLDLLNFFILLTNFDNIFIFLMLYFILKNKRKGGIKLKNNIVNFNSYKKIGTVTVSVYEESDHHTIFNVETNNDDVLPVSYVIEDTLKLY